MGFPEQSASFSNQPFINRSWPLGFVTGNSGCVLMRFRATQRSATALMPSPGNWKMFPGLDNLPPQIHKSINSCLKDSGGRASTKSVEFTCILAKGRLAWGRIREIRFSWGLFCSTFWTSKKYERRVAKANVIVPSLTKPQPHKSFSSCFRKKTLIHRSWPLGLVIGNSGCVLMRLRAKPALCNSPDALTRQLEDVCPDFR